MAKFTVSRPAREDPTARIIRQGTERHRREAADRNRDENAAHDRQWFTGYSEPATTRTIYRRKRRQRLWAMLASAVLFIVLVVLVVLALINGW